MDILLSCYNGILTSLIIFFIVKQLVKKPISDHNALLWVLLFSVTTSILVILLPNNLLLKSSLNFLIGILLVYRLWQIDIFTSMVTFLATFTIMYVGDIFTFVGLTTLTTLTVKQYQSSYIAITIGSAVTFIIAVLCIILIKKINIDLIFRLKRRFPKFTAFAGVNIVAALSVLAFIVFLEEWINLSAGELETYLKHKYLLLISLGLIAICIAIVGIFIVINYAVINKIKLDQFVENSGIDFLSKALSRDAGMRRLESELKQNGELVIGFIDIDNLKFMNDKYGHSTGDLLIKTVTDKIKSNIRHSDFIFRYGGDEFVVIFKNCSIECSCDIIERVRSELSTIKLISDTSFKINFSVGYSSSKEYPDHSINQLIEAADEQMYNAKKLFKAQYRYEQNLSDNDPIIGGVHN